MTKTILIKVGTNVLTEKSEKLDLKQIESLVEQIVDLKKQGANVVLISSGAVGAGLDLKNLDSIKDKVIKKQMLAAIGQNHLMRIYTDFFKKHDLVIAQALLSRSDFSIREKYLNIKNTLLSLMDNDVVPIINENDVVSTEELSFSDNDILASYTAALIKADKFIILTVVDGLYDKDPSEKDAKLIKEVQSIDENTLSVCSKSKSSLGLGGMKSKINAAKIATDLGIETVIINGKTQKIKDVMEGNFVGTTFVPVKTKKKSIYYWLLAGSEIKGKVFIDSGAVNAVKNRKSLLFVGVSRLEGNFEKGDTLEVYDENESKIAVGLTSFGSESAKQKLEQPKEKLKNEKELIHCDNLKVL